MGVFASCGLSGSVGAAMVAAPTYAQGTTPPAMPCNRQSRWRCQVAQAFAVGPERSKRSRFITFVHALTKSCTNTACASLLPYTSARARNTEFEPNTRSATVPVHLGVPLLRSTPSNTPGDAAD